VLDQLSEGVLLINPNDQSIAPRVHCHKAGGLLNSSSEEEVEEAKSTQISYWNNSLKEILVSKDNELSDIEELLTAIKFKVLFSSD